MVHLFFSSIPFIGTFTHMFTTWWRIYCNLSFTREVRYFLNCRRKSRFLFSFTYIWIVPRISY